MDYNIVVIISENILKKIGINEIKTEWENQMIPYDPRRFQTNEKISIIGVDYKKYDNKYSISNPVAIKIVDGLRELEWKANKAKNELNDNAIIKLLNRICGLNQFAIIIWEDDNIIDRFIEFTDKENIADLIVNVLDWNNPYSVSINRGLEIKESEKHGT